jgi:hypothetical protein
MDSEEPRCASCKWGSYMITFDDETHMEEDGKPVMLCVNPDPKACDDPDGYPDWQPREKRGR